MTWVLYRTKPDEDTYLGSSRVCLLLIMLSLSCCWSSLQVSFCILSLLHCCPRLSLTFSLCLVWKTYFAYLAHLRSLCTFEVSTNLSYLETCRILNWQMQACQYVAAGLSIFGFRLRKIWGNCTSSNCDMHWAACFEAQSKAVALSQIFLMLYRDYLNLINLCLLGSYFSDKALHSILQES